MSSPFLEFAASPVIQSYGGPVVDAVAKATILLAAAGLVTLALRRSSAAVRHLIWTLALLAVLVLPVLTLALPRWQVPVVTVAPAEPVVSAPGALVGDSGFQAPPITRTRASVVAAAEDTPGPRREPTSTASRLAEISWAALLGGLWLAGVLAVVGRLAVGLLAVRWMSRRTTEITDAAWLPLARELAAAIGVTDKVTFLQSPRATMPMAWGLLKPTVLMPADAETWPHERLRIVLLHELAHVKRHDCLTHALVQLACALHWFNPLVWIAARHVRTERERACDDLVLAAGTGGADYADQLLEMARTMRSGRFPALTTGATLAMAHRSQLEGRLMAILDPQVPRAGLSRLRTLGASTLAACAVVPLASLQPWAYEQLTPVTSVARTQPSSASASSGAGSTPHAQPVPRPMPVPDPLPLVETPRTGMARGLSEGLGAALAEGLSTGLADAVAEGVAQAATQSAVQSSIQRGMSHGLRQAENWASAVSLENDHNGEQDSQTSSSKADPRMIAALTAALKDSDEEVRETAMHALVQLRDPAVFDPLVQALRDTSADVREQAAHALGQLRDRRAIEPLVATLNDVNASVREQVIFALGQLRDPATVDAIAQALKDASADVREQAAFALGQIRDRRAVTALAAALDDVAEDVREQVVFALGQLRDPATIDGLTTALRDAKANVREQAAFALGQIRDRRAVEPLISALKDADPDVREQAAFALGQLRDRSAVEALVVALKDENPSVREQVAFALGQIRDPRAIDALTTALKDTNASVRKQAAFALGQIAR